MVGPARHVPHHHVGDGQDLPIFGLLDEDGHAPRHQLAVVLDPLRPGDEFPVGIMACGMKTGCPTQHPVISKLKIPFPLANLFFFTARPPTIFAGGEGEGRGACPDGETEAGKLFPQPRESSKLQRITPNWHRTQLPVLGAPEGVEVSFAIHDHAEFRPARQFGDGLPVVHDLREEKGEKKD